MKIATRCSSLDSLSGGGFDKGVVSELCGKNGVGKTQICLQTVLSAASTRTPVGTHAQAIYVSSSMPFPSTRLAQLATNRSGQLEIPNPMDRVLVKYACDPYKMVDAVNNIQQLIGMSTLSVNVVVIDSLCGSLMHQFPNTKDGFKERKRIIKAIGYGLQRIAKNNHLSILVCNSVVDSTDNNQPNFITSGRRVKPAIGEVWNSYVCVRWILCKDYGADGQFTRSMSLCIGNMKWGACRYTLTLRGVEEYDEKDDSC